MESESWIKMGFKIIKTLIMIVLIVVLLHSNMSDRQLNRTENFNLNKTLGMTAMAEKKEEEKPKPVVTEKKEPVVKKPTVVYAPAKGSSSAASLNKFSGELTGYVAHCPACNGTLACKSSYNVYKNGVVSYPDKEFGNVRIVASSKKLKCGSIVKFNLKTISKEPIYAVVLDRGVLGRDLDLLVATTSDAYKLVGRRNITYDVLRNGW